MAELEKCKQCSLGTHQFSSRNYFGLYLSLIRGVLIYFATVDSRMRLGAVQTMIRLRASNANVLQSLTFADWYNSSVAVLRLWRGKVVY